MHKQQDTPDTMGRSKNKPMGKRKRTRESILGFLQGKCFSDNCQQGNCKIKIELIKKSGPPLPSILKSLTYILSVPLRLYPYFLVFCDKLLQGARSFSGLSNSTS